jgi:hypothetical protein
MKARYVYESLRFEREGNPLDKIQSGINYSPKTFRVDGIFTRYDVPIKEPYDIRKFLQNIQNGFYPVNFFLKQEGTEKRISSDWLKEYGYTGIVYEDKYYPLG